MFLLMAMVSAMSASLRLTVPGSIDDFLEQGRMPDAWIATEPVSPEGREELLKIPGVYGAVGGLFLPGQVTFSSGENSSPGFFSVEEEDLRRYHVVESVPGQKKYVNVRVSAYYAKKNGVRPGDTLTLHTPFGDEDAYVDALVSTPETMRGQRSEASWNDAAGYGYVFLSRADADRLFGTYDKANYWSLWLEKGLTGEERGEVLEKAKTVFGGSVVSAVLYEDSSAKAGNDDLRSMVGSLCGTFPVLIYATGLLFTILFISQVIRSRQKDIGILMALGHDRGAALRIYLQFALLLLIPGVIIGTAAGFLITSVITRLFVQKYELPRIIFRLDMREYVIMILLEAAICVISCVISVFSVVKADPAGAITEKREGSSRSSVFFKKDGKDPFIKLGLLSLSRNRRRTALSILAVMACVTISASALEYLFAYEDAMPRTFGRRYTYDALVGVENGWESLDRIKAVEGVSAAEPVLTFVTTVENGDRSLREKVRAVLPDARLMVPYTADYEPVPLSDGVVMDEWAARQLDLSVGDTVTIEGVPLAVTGICRNLIDRTEYITFETAEKMGFSGPDVIAIRTGGAKEPKEVYKEIASLPDHQYTSLLSTQRASEDDYTLLTRVASGSLTAAALLMGLILVINMVTLSVQERKYEFAVFLSLGVPDGKFAGMIAFESLVMFALAAAAAFPLAFFCMRIPNSLMSSASHAVEMKDSGKAFGLSLVLSLVCLLAGVASGIKRIHRLDPVSLLHKD